MSPRFSVCSHFAVYPKCAVGGVCAVDCVIAFDMLVLGTLNSFFFAKTSHFRNRKLELILITVKQTMHWLRFTDMRSRHDSA